MSNSLTVREKSIRGVCNAAGELVPLVIQTSPREGREDFGISIRAFLIEDPSEPLMSLDSYFEAGVVQVGNGHLLVNEHYRGQGIGSACLAKAFSWADHYYPDFPLSPFKIGSSKTGDEAKALKRLYERFGMHFPEPRPKVGSWFCRDLKCCDITIPNPPERVDLQGMIALEAHLHTLRQRSLDRSKDVQEESYRADYLARGRTIYKWGMIGALALCAILAARIITA